MANRFGYQILKFDDPGVFSKHMKASYSQAGEDLIVKYIFDALGNQKPTYLDIGAHHPYYLSNTALFYLNGSRGINIEPDPNLFVNINNHRKFDINLNVGVSNQIGELDFYLISSSTLNTFSKEEAERYVKEGDYKIEKIQKINVTTLKNIIDEYSDGKFPDFLSLDAEGVDELIIREIDFQNNFPMVICVETISFSTSGRGKKNTLLVNYLSDNGYLVYADTNINTIFVRKDVWER